MNEHEFLSELSRRYPEMVLVPAARVTEIRDWVLHAASVIDQATELMDMDQLSRWEGYRAALETCPFGGVPEKER